MVSDQLTQSIDAPLAHRLHHALNVGNEEIFQAVADPSMEVLRAVLKNPQESKDAAGLVQCYSAEASNW
jgi:hypothetical protein